MRNSLTFSLFKAVRQKTVYPPGFAWGFSYHASSRLTWKYKKRGCCLIAKAPFLFYNYRIFRRLLYFFFPCFLFIRGLGYFRRSFFRRGFRFLEAAEKLHEIHVEDERHDHAVDGLETILHEVGHQRTDRPGENRRLAVAGNFIVLDILAADDEEVGHQNGADGRDERVQNVQIAAEVVVQRDGENRAERTADENQILLREARDVRKTEAGRVEGVVVRRPDVERQDDDTGDQKSLGDKNIGNIIRFVEHSSDGAEEEHQAVADEESDGRRADGDAAVFRKTDEVGRACAAGDEGADGQRHSRAERQGAFAGRGEILQRVPCVRIVAEDLQGGEAAADGDGGNGDERDDRQCLNTEIGGCCEQDAGDDHRNPDIAFNAFFLQIRHDRKRAHRDADAEPADLRNRQNRRRQCGAAFAERAAREKMDGQTR